MILFRTNLLWTIVEVARLYFYFVLCCILCFSVTYFVNDYFSLFVVDQDSNILGPFIFIGAKYLESPQRN